MKQIKSIVVLVHDQQEALNFYTEKLGFEVHTDASFGEGNRWVTVNIPNNKDLEIILALAKVEEAKVKVGNQVDPENAIMGFYTDDIEANIDNFKAKGVELASGLIDEPYGKFIFFKDLYGNKFYLHQDKA
jgi:catechol 2,3-dioxygenase-like lactoylglutathione lyase family enzyme